MYTVKNSLTKLGNQPQSYFPSKGWMIFVLMTLILWVVNFIQQEFIFTDEFFFNTWGDKFNEDRIYEIIQTKNKWKWVYYLFVPGYIFFWIFFVTTALTIGALLKNAQYGFLFYWGVVMRSYPVYLLNFLIVFILTFFFPVNSLYDLLKLDFFSLAGILQIADYSIWYIYPMKSINVFEMGFWVLLTYNISQGTNQSFSRSLGFVVSTYGVALFLWTLFIMFIQINFA